MKKALILFSCLAALYSCSDELEGDRMASAQMTINATFEDQSGSTRTSLGTGNTVVWDQGDALSVFDFNTPPTNSQFTLTSGAGKTSGTFAGTGVKSSEGYFAVYPYSSDLKFTYDTDHPKGDIGVRNLILTTQYARKGSIPSNIPMVAYAAAPDNDGTSVNLSFKNVFAYLKLSIDYKCKSVTIVPNASDESLTPRTFHVALDADGVPYMHDISFLRDVNHEVTLVNQDGSDLQPGTYYVAVYPQTLEDGFKMTFTSSFDAEKTITKKAQKSVTLKRSTILNLGTIDITELASLNGSGTAKDPYQISDWCDLCLISTRINNNITGYPSACYKLMKDINCEGQSFVPIGTKNVYFSGLFDGNNKTISNITYEKSAYREDGNVHALFGFINSATIKDLKIKNPSINVYDTDKIMIASPLVGFAYSNSSSQPNYITNCSASGSKLLLSKEKMNIYFGGMVAYNLSDIQIEGCTNSVSVQFSVKTEYGAYVGGMIGYTEADTDDVMTWINKCRNSGNITIHAIRDGQRDTETFAEMGGILGMAEDHISRDVCCRINNCVNTGSQSTSSVNSVASGGIIGYMNSDGFTGTYPGIGNCLNKGALDNGISENCAYYVGGISGQCYGSSSISFTYCVNCAVAGNQSGQFSDGITNYTDPGTPVVSNCFSLVSSSSFKGCTVKSDLTAEDMNSLVISNVGFVQWRTNADGTLDLDF